MSSERKIELALQTYEVWAVSTSHIPQEDTNKLSDSRVACVEYPEGWWICVPPGPDDQLWEALREQLSPAFINLLALADDLDIRWINLDADGAIYPWLPRYNW